MGKEEPGNIGVCRSFVNFLKSDVIGLNLLLLLVDAAEGSELLRVRLSKSVFLFYQAAAQTFLVPSCQAFASPHAFSYAETPSFVPSS